jgi:hypothetical protein
MRIFVRRSCYRSFSILQANDCTGRVHFHHDLNEERRRFGGVGGDG